MPNQETTENFKLLDREASILFDKLQKGCPETLKRLVKSDHPNFQSYSTLKLFLNARFIKLHHIKWMLAKEMGYKTWSQFEKETEKKLATLILVRDFVNNAVLDERCLDLSDPDRALWLLDSSPEWLKDNFLVALITGNAKYVISYLNNNPSCVNKSFGPKDWPPLLYVAYSHFLTSDYGNKPWQAEGFYQIVRNLIEAGADTNATYYLTDFKKTERNVSYGFRAANRADLISLIEPNGNPEQKTIFDSYNPKLFDIESRETKKNQASHNAEILKKSYTLLKELERSGASRIQHLLLSGANPNFSPPHFNGKSSLHIALNLGRSDEILNELLEYGADPFLKDGMGMTPARLGMRYGRLSFLAEIRKSNQIKNDAINLEDEFWCAVFLGRIAESQKLLKKCGIDPSKLNESSIPLFSRAAYFGNKLAVRILIDQGFDPTNHDEKGMTPLHWAVWRADIIMIEWLLKSENAPLNQCNFYDATPLDTAIIAGQKKAGMKKDYLQIIRILLSAGSQLNQSTKLFLADIDCNENDPDSELHKIFWMEGFNELGSSYFDDLHQQESIA